MGGWEENNIMTLRETNSNEESHVGERKPICSCSGEWISRHGQPWAMTTCNGHVTNIALKHMRFTTH